MKKIVLICFVLFFYQYIYSQTGPGGVGGPSSNTVWLDASSLSLSNGTPISTWPDVSGNGNDFTQGTSNQQPKWYNYSKPTIRFDGNNDYLSGGAIGGLNSNTLSHYIVFRGTTVQTGTLWSSIYTESADLLNTRRTSSGNIASWIVNSVGDVKNNFIALTGVDEIYTGVWDGAGALTYSSYQNGTIFGFKKIAGNTATGNSQNRIGAKASGGSYKYDGDIYEVFYYNELLDSADRNIIDNYLSSKYNITVANDLYAYEATHASEVFGIGQESDGSNTTAQGTGIVEISNASALSDGEYILAGHNNVYPEGKSTDVPVGLIGAERTLRTWRVDVTGAPGTVTMKYDVSTLDFSDPNYYLLVDDDGDFSNGGTTEYGPFTDVANIVTFTGVTVADGNYLAIAGDLNGGIFSKATGNWNTTSTWSCSCIPTSGDNVTIKGFHTVTIQIGQSAVVDTLTINGTLNINNSFLDAEGDIDVNGTLSSLTGQFTFSGSVKQRFRNLSGSTVQIDKLIVNNSNNVELHTGNFSVYELVQVTDGQLQNISGTFTFISNSSGTAIIKTGNGNGFSGEFVIQRYFSTRSANWGDMASPMQSMTLDEWDSDPTGTTTELFMSGVNGIDGSAGGFNSVYYYNENTQAYVQVTNTTYLLSPAKGLELWLGDDFTTLNAKTIDSRGTPNYGTINVPVANSFNLVGNPYGCPILWTALTKPTLNNTYYIFNTNNGTYDAKTADFIPSHQGFWVESVGSGTLTFNENDKFLSNTSTFFRKQQPSLSILDEPHEFVEAQLKIKSNSYSYAHALKLRMNNLAIEESDQFDATFKLSPLSEAPSITSYSANSTKQLAINSFNYQEELIIPVSVAVGISGEHIIEPVNFSAFIDYYKFIELKDNKTGKVYDLRMDDKENNDIVFDISKGDNPDRFSLRLSNALNQFSGLVDNNINILKSKESTIIEINNPIGDYEISIYNSIGQKVIENILVSGENNIVINNDELPNGINIVTVKSSGSMIVKKIHY